MTPLRKRMVNDMTVRAFAENAMRSYLHSVTGLARHYRRSPGRISAQEVQDYLIYLHEERGLSWKSCNCVRHGIRFLYRVTLGLPDPHFYVPGTRRQDAFHAARDPQPRRTGAAVRGHHQLQASRLADDGLRRGTSGKRARPIAAHGHRLRADVSARRLGQGQQGPLRSALAPAAQAAAQVLAPRAPPTLAVPQPASWPADDPRGGRTHLQVCQAEGRDPQSRRDPHVEALLRHRAPRGRGRTPRHSAPARARLDPFDDALPASCTEQDKRHAVATGSVGVPTSRVVLTGGSCQPRSAGRSAGTGSGGHSPRTCRCLRGVASALDPATAGRGRLGAVSYRRSRRIQGSLRPLRRGDLSICVAPEPALPQVSDSLADPMGRASVCRSARHRLLACRVHAATRAQPPRPGASRTPLQAALQGRFPDLARVRAQSPLARR